MNVFRKTRKFFFTHFYLIIPAIVRMIVGYSLAILLCFYGRKAASSFLSQSQSSYFQDYPDFYAKAYNYFSPLLQQNFSSVLKTSVYFKDWLKDRSSFPAAVVRTDEEQIIFTAFYAELRSTYQLYRLFSYLIELGTYFLASFIVGVLIRIDRNVKRGRKRFICRYLLNSVFSTAVVALITYLFSLFPILGTLSSVVIFFFRLLLILLSAWILQSEGKVPLKEVYQFKNASGFYLANFVLKTISFILQGIVGFLFKGSYTLLLLVSCFYRYSDNTLLYQGEGYVALLRKRK